MELELLNAINLLRRIHVDLASIGKLLKGSLPLSNELLELGSNLVMGNVPETWLSIWEGPKDITLFINEAMRKTLKIEKLKNQPNNIKSNPLNFNDLFNPISFLNAFRQQIARSSKTSIDNLHLVNSWNASDIHSPNRLAIDGLILQGCKFDGERISDSVAENPTFTNVPTLYITFADSSKDSLNNYHKVPIYESTSREKIISYLLVPTLGLEDEQRLILSGSAFFITADF